MTVKNRFPSIFGSESRSDDAFHNLQNEVDRVFGQFRTRWPSLLTDSPLIGTDDGVLSPRVNVAETDEAVEIEVDLPGFESKDIDVSSQQRSLVIEANKSDSKDEKKKDYHLVERSEGHYRRVIPLEYEFDADSVKARCKNGVLTVTIPKSEEIKQSARKISVETA